MVLGLLTALSDPGPGALTETTQMLVHAQAGQRGDYPADEVECEQVAAASAPSNGWTGAREAGVGVDVVSLPLTDPPREGRYPHFRTEA